MPTPRRAGTQAGRSALALLLAGALAGCGALGGLGLLAPETAGLERLAPDLYVEPATEAPTRVALLAAREQARRAVAATWGEPLLSRPVIHACATEACALRFGGGGAIAKVYGSHILLSPRGLDWHFLAHEWSHAEFHERLGLIGLWRMPAWFDEGVAVAVSEAPEHGEAHWRAMIVAGIAPVPAGELGGLRDGSEWIAAIHRHGDHLNAGRRARGEPEWHTVYASVGHFIRPWLADAGTAGLAEVTAGLRDGSLDADALWARVNAARLRADALTVR